MIVGVTLTINGFGCQNEREDLVGSAAPTKNSTNPTLTGTDEPTAPFELEPGFTLLNRDQFEAFGDEPETWKVTPDGIACTGKPRGYLYSPKSFENFTWRLEFRFIRPTNLTDDSKFKGNTGFLVYVKDDHKLWPQCIEVQGKNVQMCALKENGGAEPILAKDDDTTRVKVRKPVGQWNSVDITSKDGGLAIQLNGYSVSSSAPGSMTSGAIGIQAEDYPFEVRRMRIRVD